MRAVPFSRMKAEKLKFSLPVAGTFILLDEWMDEDDNDINRTFIF